MPFRLDYRILKRNWSKFCLFIFRSYTTNVIFKYRLRAFHLLIKQLGITLVKPYHFSWLLFGPGIFRCSEFLVVLGSFKIPVYDCVNACCRYLCLSLVSGWYKIGHYCRICGCIFVLCHKMNLKRRLLLSSIFVDVMLLFFFFFMTLTYYLTLSRWFP